MKPFQLRALKILFIFAALDMCLWLLVAPSAAAACVHSHKIVLHAQLKYRCTGIIKGHWLCGGDDRFSTMYTLNACDEVKK